ncbi:MAG: SEC-C domain-containing protein [Dehalococcoidia bacterium]|nr:SEC-C domain-containing protein [Dehalococcoidia bacterium]
MQRENFNNGPCPCGSGKKYKHCCGRKVIKKQETDKRDGNV